MEAAMDVTKEQMEATRLKLEARRKDLLGMRAAIDEELRNVEGDLEVMNKALSKTEPRRLSLVGA